MPRELSEADKIYYIIAFMSIINIKELNRKELAELLAFMGQPPFREKQIFAWLSKGAAAFDDMRNLPISLRKALAEKCVIESLEIELEQRSKDGTRKYLLRCPDGEFVEAVFMSYEYGNTICISTQVGCNMGCVFCASAIGGKRRDLKAWEMLDELLAVQRAAGPVSRVVLMGMGEPFDNYDELAEFLRRVHDPEGVNMSFRNITVSSCGIVPAIERFGDEFPQVNLAVSLHESDQKRREALMPIAKKYDLRDLMKVCTAHEKKTGRRVSYEYALAAGINDGEERAEELAALLKGQLCHVNLIALNPVLESGLRGSDRRAARAFAERLERLGIPTTVRRELGSDIDAACGQLRKKKV